MTTTTKPTSAAIGEHDFNTGKYCQNPECHFVYHYSCAECGADCTQGSPDGPATQEIDGITRCYKCNLKLPRYHAVGKQALIAKASAEMLKALEAIVSDTLWHSSRDGSDFAYKARNIARAAIRRAREGQ